MKTLSVKQPWASLIIHGYKDVENRTRRTTYRGPLAIHVSLKPSKPGGHLDDLNNMDLTNEELAVAEGAARRNPFAGYIIGTVDLVDCVQDSESRWAFADHWHWVFANAHRLETPVAAKGRLGLWEWEL